MFFLYVLKEERNCPVSEVFDQFIKPMPTSRFKSDFAEDYSKLLRKMKRQMQYDKLFDKAVRRLKLKKGRNEYLSDSCVPSNTNELNRKGGSKLKMYARQQIGSLNQRRFVSVKGKNNRLIRIPTLNIAAMAA